MITKFEEFNYFSSIFKVLSTEEVDAVIEFFNFVGFFAISLSLVEFLNFVRRWVGREVWGGEIRICCLFRLWSNIWVGDNEDPFTC